MRWLQQVSDHDVAPARTCLSAQVQVAVRASGPLSFLHHGGATRRQGVAASAMHDPPGWGS
eukprot:2163971-Alexandrium_andersonii.AAC.1